MDGGASIVAKDLLEQLLQKTTLSHCSTEGQNGRPISSHLAGLVTAAKEHLGKIQQNVTNDVGFNYLAKVKSDRTNPEGSDSANQYTYTGRIRSNPDPEKFPTLLEGSNLSVHEYPFTYKVRFEDTSFHILLQKEL